MNNYGKVAVITRTKNRNILLKRAIESVSNQTFSEWIMVIVNDGGNPDEVEKLIDSLNPEIKMKIKRVHNPESLGMEAASNKGIKSVDSKYVIIHDDDDSWHPQFLERTVKELESNKLPEYKGVVTFSTRIIEKIENETVSIQYSEPYNTWLESISLYRMAAGNVFPPISFLFERSVFEEIGYFREDLPVLGDWDFNLRFLEKYNVLLIKEELALYHHRLDMVNGAYSNSVIGGNSKHVFYDTHLRNEYLRNDMNAGKVGLGYLVNIGKSFEVLHAQIGPIETLINKLKQNKKVKRIAKILLRKK